MKYSGLIISVDAGTYSSKDRSIETPWETFDYLKKLATGKTALIKCLVIKSATQRYKIFRILLRPYWTIQIAVPRLTQVRPQREAEVPEGVLELPLHRLHVRILHQEGPAQLAELACTLHCMVNVSFERGKFDQFDESRHSVCIGSSQANSKRTKMLLSFGLRQ